jgi:hypothetical protein
MPPKPRPHGKKPPPRLKSSRPPAAGVDRRTLLIAAIGGAVAIAVVAAVLVLSGGGGGSEGAGGTRSALEAAGCTLTIKPAALNVGDHSDFPDPDARSPKWNTDPPSSGPHYGQTIVFGAYSEPLQLGRLVHNLEHGAVYVLYGDDVPDATVQQLRSFYADHTTGTVLAPYPRLGQQIALGAWLDPGLPEAKSDRGSGVLAKCDAFDERAFEAFFDAFQFKGPERFPRDLLLPGQ